MKEKIVELLEKQNEMMEKQGEMIKSVEERLVQNNRLLTLMLMTPDMNMKFSEQAYETLIDKYRRLSGLKDVFE